MAYAPISRTYPLVPLGQSQRRLRPRQVRRAAELEGFSPAEALQMSQIAHGESDYQPGVVQPDPGDHMVGRGLIQATPNAWGADSEAMKYYNQLGGDKAMGNPRIAMRMAHFLYSKAGNSFSPWYGTKYLQQNVGNVPSVLKPGARAKAPTMNDSGPANSLMLTGTPQVPVGGGGSSDNPITNLIGIFNRMNQATGLGPQFTSALAPSVAENPNTQVFNPMDYLKNVKTTPANAPSVGGKNEPDIHPKDLPEGLDKFDGRPVAGWIAPILRAARQDGVQFTLSSGWRSDEEQVRIWNSGVRPAAKPKALGGGGSNHSEENFPGGAVDVNAKDGGAARLAAWLAKHPKYNKLLVYAGSKDPVHFSHPHNGSY